MPIWLRNFTFHKIKDWYEKEKEEAEKAYNPQKNNNTSIARPNIKPAYTSKAFK